MKFSKIHTFSVLFGVVGFTLAFPFPQQFQQQIQQQQFNVAQDTNNAYLPQRNQGQGQLVSQSFLDTSQSRQFNSGSEEILNLNPPLPLIPSSAPASGPSSSAASGAAGQVVRALVSSPVQEVQLQPALQQQSQPQPQSQQLDSYANYRPATITQQNTAPAALTSGSSVGGASTGGNVASALVTSNNNNPHEYGETVPGEFSSFDSYAAYQNHQSN